LDDNRDLRPILTRSPGVNFTKCSVDAVPSRAKAVEFHSLDGGSIK
jgi:hypothetical protein